MRGVPEKMRPRGLLFRKVVGRQSNSVKVSQTNRSRFRTPSQSFPYSRVRAAAVLRGQKTPDGADGGVGVRQNSSIAVRPASGPQRNSSFRTPRRFACTAAAEEPTGFSSACAPAPLSGWRPAICIAL